VAADGKRSFSDYVLRGSLHSDDVAVLEYVAASYSSACRKRISRDLSLAMSPGITKLALARAQEGRALGSRVPSSPAAASSSSSSSSSCQRLSPGSLSSNLDSSVVAHLCAKAEHDRGTQALRHFSIGPRHLFPQALGCRYYGFISEVLACSDVSTLLARWCQLQESLDTVRIGRVKYLHACVAQ